MTRIQNRVRKGVRSGGQFAADARSESHLRLVPDLPVADIEEDGDFDTPAADPVRVEPEVINGYQVPALENDGEGYMGGGAWKGSKFDPNLYDVAVIAKNVRGDFKEAKQAGYLPKDLDCRVNIDKFAGGQSMTVSVRGLDDDFIYDKEWGPDEYGRYRRSAQMKELEEKVKTIANAYNYDNSNSQYDYFDSRYYCHINVEDENSRVFREKMDAEEKARRAARAARKAAAGAR